MNLIVFTDLDGTLLDHDTYSHGPAAAALAELKRLGVPIVLNTSKTAAEVREWREKLGITDPFIVENGSAAIIGNHDIRFSMSNMAQTDHDATHCFGATRASIREKLTVIKQQYNYKYLPFSALSSAEIAAHTGLDVHDASLADRREYSEPLVWQDGEAQLAQFSSALKEENLRCIRGGRFLHVIGAGAGKGRAMRWLAAHYEPKPAPVLIALGDSENDVGMLNSADIAVQVRSRHHDYPGARGQRKTLSTKAYGPAGWAEAIKTILGQ